MDALANERVEQLTHARLLRDSRYRQINRGISAFLREAEEATGRANRAGGPEATRYQRPERLFLRDVIAGPDGTALFVGLKMTETTALLGEVTDMVKAAREELETTKNQTFQITHVLFPELLGHIERLRQMRMALTMESAEATKALRDIRGFFLHRDYAEEVGRMERLVALCREFAALKQSGVLDVVCESALRLALKDPQ